MTPPGVQGSERPCPNPLHWVGQEDPEGCGVAVLAMLTDDSYAKVRAIIDADEWVGHSGDWRKGGVAQPVLERYLTQRGWFFARRYSTWDTGGEWPPTPFADRHYAIVANAGGGHFVVMDRAGVVLDPLREGTFALADWEVVNCVVGLKR